MNLKESLAVYDDDGWSALGPKRQKQILDAAREYADLLERGREMEWCELHDEPIDLALSSHEPGPDCEVFNVVVVRVDHE